MSDSESTGTCASCSADVFGTPICDACAVNEELTCVQMELDAKHAKLVEVADKLRAAEDELARFREREPLVQALLDAVKRGDDFDGVDLAAIDVRRFKVTP